MPQRTLTLGLWSLMKGSTPAQMDLRLSMGAMSLPPRDTSALKKGTMQGMRARADSADCAFLSLGLNRSTVPNPPSIP